VQRAANWLSDFGRADRFVLVGEHGGERAARRGSHGVRRRGERIPCPVFRPRPRVPVGAAGATRVRFSESRGVYCPRERRECPLRGPRDFLLVKGASVRRLANNVSDFGHHRRVVLVGEHDGGCAAVEVGNVWGKSTRAGVPDRPPRPRSTSGGTK